MDQKRTAPEPEPKRWEKGETREQKTRTDKRTGRMAPQRDDQKPKQNQNDQKKKSQRPQPGWDQKRMAPKPEPERDAKGPKRWKGEAGAMALREDD